MLLLDGWQCVAGQLDSRLARANSEVSMWFRLCSYMLPALSKDARAILCSRLAKMTVDKAWGHHKALIHKNEWCTKVQLDDEESVPVP
jgi:hypothetical protein